MMIIDAKLTTRMHDREDLIQTRPTDYLTLGTLSFYLGNWK